jgi:hypothetical protein
MRSSSLPRRRRRARKPIFPFIGRLVPAYAGAFVALAAEFPGVKICQVQIFLEGKYLNNNMYFR